MITQNPIHHFVRYPEFLVLVLNYLVFRQGGQVKFDAQDLAHVSQQYSNVVVTQNFETEEIILKISTRKS